MACAKWITHDTNDPITGGYVKVAINKGPTTQSLGEFPLWFIY